MPIISHEATKKAKAIAYAVNVMQKEGTFNTNEQGPMQDLFIAGGFKLKKDTPHERLQISCSVLYQHWKTGKEPKIYRKLVSNRSKVNAVYSLKIDEFFKAYKDL